MTSRWSKQRRQKRKYEEYMQDDIVASTSGGSEAGIKSSGPSNISEPCVHDTSHHTKDSPGGISELGESELWTYDLTSSDHSAFEEEKERIPNDRQPNDTTNSQILIRDWALKHQISHSALKELLNILKSQYDKQLPSDPRTLCNTPSDLSDKIKQACGGEYFHFGLENALQEFIESLSDTQRARIASIFLNVNCDGIPLFKSSAKQFWPILVQFCVNDMTTSEPFPVGIFLGNSKPNNVKDFLKKFLDELENLLKNGYELKNNKYSVSVRCFICDAPARQFLKCIKSHSGYHSCERCMQQGIYDGTITFPELDAQLRTDANFADMRDADHHKGPSPLLDLNIGLVTKFVLDPMHLLYLGVMRKLIHLWLSGPLPTRIGSQNKDRISAKLVELAKYMPSEFSRKPRSLSDLDRFKATEFRAFLLYLGPVVLLKNLDENIYKNFLLLSVSTYLLSKYTDSENLQAAKKYLTAFVKHFEKLYGTRHLVYNVHNLIHLTDDVHLYGTLDKFSAFPFENYLGKLKKLLRKPNSPLTQVANRISENKTSRSERNIIKYPHAKQQHSNGPLIDDKLCSQFRALFLKDFCIKLTCADQGIMVKNHVGRVMNIVQYEASPDAYHVLYHSYKRYEDLYHYPLKSGSLGVYVVSHESNTLEICSVKEIQEKYMLFPLGTKIVAFPMVHTCHQQ